jgi:urease accessory protein
MHSTPPFTDTAPIFHPVQPTGPADCAKGWRAHLTLQYGTADHKTVLLRQRHSGPLMVQKPFYPEGPKICHTYLIHPPGGVVGGDMLGIDLCMEKESHAVITTPAAGKFYRSAGATAVQTNRLVVGAEAALEWMPQETIVYDQANARLHTVVQLETGAKFIGWEMVCLGLPASRQPFVCGNLDQRFEIWQADRPVLLERLQIHGRDPVLTSNWGLAGLPVTGILIATSDNKDLLSELRDATAGIDSEGVFAVTSLNGLTVCRFLGADIYAGFKFFLRAWEVLRPAVTGNTVCKPRIWET